MLSVSADLEAVTPLMASEVSIHLAMLLHILSPCKPLVFWASCLCCLGARWLQPAVTSCCFSLGMQKKMGLLCALAAPGGDPGGKEACPAKLISEQ